MRYMQGPLCLLTATAELLLLELPSIAAARGGFFCSLTQLPNGLPPVVRKSEPTVIVRATRLKIPDMEFPKPMIEPFRKYQEVKMGSERSFGLVFAIVFAMLALWPLAKGEAVELWAISAALFFLALGCLRPAVLRPLNVAWFRFGLLLGALVTPAVMALLYVTAFLPTSLVLRFMGRDPLALEREPDRASYWVVRDGSVRGQSAMNRQF
jgi:hypothetical protein